MLAPAFTARFSNFLHQVKKADMTGHAIFPKPFLLSFGVTPITRGKKFARGKGFAALSVLIAAAALPLLLALSSFKVLGPRRRPWGTMYQHLSVI